jgi:hypothetical protein
MKLNVHTELRHFVQFGPTYPSYCDMLLKSKNCEANGASLCYGTALQTRPFLENTSVSTPCGNWSAYLRRRPASRKRQYKGNPVSGFITGPPCSWCWKYGALTLHFRGSLRWDSKVWLRVLRESDWIIQLQTTDPSSRQRGRSTRRRKEVSTIRKLNLVMDRKGVPDTKMDWPTDCRS